MTARRQFRVRQWLLVLLTAVSMVGFLFFYAATPSAEITADGYLVITVDDPQYLNRFCGSDELGIVGCARFDPKALPHDRWCVLMVLAHPEKRNKDWTRLRVIEHEVKHCNIGAFHF